MTNKTHDLKKRVTYFDGRIALGFDSRYTRFLFQPIFLWIRLTAASMGLRYHFFLIAELLMFTLG